MTDERKPLIAKINDLARIVKLREGELKQAFDHIYKLEAKLKGCEHVLWQMRHDGCDEDDPWMNALARTLEKEQE